MPHCNKHHPNGVVSNLSKIENWFRCWSIHLPWCAHDLARVVRLFALGVVLEYACIRFVFFPGPGCDCVFCRLIMMIFHLISSQNDHCRCVYGVICWNIFARESGIWNRSICSAICHWNQKHESVNMFICKMYNLSCNHLTLSCICIDNGRTHRLRMPFGNCNISSYSELSRWNCTCLSFWKLMVAHRVCECVQTAVANIQHRTKCCSFDSFGGVYGLLCYFFFFFCNSFAIARFRDRSENNVYCANRRALSMCVPVCRVNFLFDNFY